MRIGATRTQADLQREVGLLDVARIAHDYKAWEYETPISTSASAFTRYGAAMFTVNTRSGDVVDLEFYLACSAGTAGGRVKGRLLLDGIPIGYEKQGAVAASATSGVGTIVHGRVRTTVTAGDQAFAFQWCVAGAASAYSTGLEIFITVIDGIRSL